MAVSAKICGITRPEDAELAVRHGAAFVGVIFAWGPRVVSPALAREIVAAAGRVPVVAVIGSPATTELFDMIAATGVGGVQVHGKLEQDARAALGAAGVFRWNVASIGSAVDLAPTIQTARREADAVMVEAAVPGGAGGRGVVVDTRLAARAREELRDFTMILAGGLAPDTVAEAISLVGPDVVDVSSGVEISPGIKNQERIIRFLEAVRDAGSAASDGS